MRIAGSTLLASGWLIVHLLGCTSAHSPKEVEAVLPPPADLVLLGGRLLEAESPTATAVACRDGRIVFVGSDEQARDWIGPKTRVFPLSGAALMPGLTDAHGHLLGLGDSLARVDLVGTASFSEVVERAAARAASAPRGTWILGRGWDQNDWPEKAFPDHHALSEQTPDHPSFLRRIDGHAGLANAEALRIAGVTRHTPDPEGGRILKDATSGEPTGVLVDNAMRLVDRVIPAPTHEERTAALARAMQECVALGLTEVHDAGVDLETITCYRELASAGRMPIRVYAMVSGGRARADAAHARESDEIEGNPALAAYLERGPEIGAAGGLLTVRAVKLYADGALGSRGAALLEPYADDPENRGLLVSDPEAIRETTVRCLKAGLQVCVHAIGDRGNRVVLDAFERALAEVPSKDARLRIEHAQVLSPSDIPRFARLGVIASMQPTHATSDMPWVPDRVGPERARGAYAWRSLVRSGVTLAFGSDFPVESASPILGIYAGLTRQDLEGRPAGGWLPEERLTPVEVLRAFTAGAAYAAFEESQGGAIAVGKRADLTALSLDPLTAAPRELLGAKVVATVVSGRVVYGSPKMAVP